MSSRLCKPRRSVTAKSSDFAIIDDLAGLPVTEAELDAVEAFLMGAVRDLLSKDWEVPRTHAEIRDIPASRRRGS